MNYRDYFKKEAVNAQLKNEPKLTNVDPAELEKGTKHEMEHATDERTARIIAAQHLKDDPKYYTKLDKAGIDECGFEDAESGMPKLGGALAIPHHGQPIHMSKIIQVGPIGAAATGGTASGALSGMTSCEKKGVAADKGGVKANVDGDREPITAGGKKLDPSIATKSVGGQVVAGEGEKQGGPNTKGTYANTAKMDGGSNNSCTPKRGQDVSINLQEHKNKIRGIVKEVLKEITFNKKTGKWERINELSIPSNLRHGTEDDPVDRTGDAGEVGAENPIGEAHDEEVGRNAGQSEGGFDPNVFEVDMKMGPSYKVAQPHMYQTADMDWARANQFDPEITEWYDEEEESALQEQYFALLTKKQLLKESEMQKMNKIRARLEKLRQLRESVNMKMGKSYKVVSPTQARCSDCDHARTVQFDPQCTESTDDGGLTDYADDLSKSKKGKDIQQAGEKFLKRIHQDIDAEKAAGKVHSYDDVDENRFAAMNPGSRGAQTPSGQAKMMGVDMGYDHAPGEKLTGGAPINIDVSKLEDIEVDGVDSSDYPDFVDAYISSASYNGRELSDAELDWLNDQHPEIAQQAAHGHMQGAGDSAMDAARDRSMGLEEAGGAAEQHKSFRTANDAPQLPKNRHDGTIDETEKKSDVHKKIQKGVKAKTAKKKQDLTYKGPKKTKSGVTHKRD